jgi:6-phosphogluconolactonase
MKKLIEILPDRYSLSGRALTLVLEKLEAAIKERGQCTVVLSGGSTPITLYAALGGQYLPWERVHIFWGDERYVPPDHRDSNQRMARHTWLDQVPIPAKNIHAMPTAAENPALDAAAYEREIADFFQVPAGVFPAFDLVLLGLGDDGHTASLFPHTPSLAVKDCLVTVGNKGGEPRLTLTVPLLNRARCTIFLVSGASKRPALAQVFAPEGDGSAYPARLIQPEGELWWLLDADAGAEIEL